MANGSLCPECRNQDSQSALSPDQYKTCLLTHQTLVGKLLFRAGGLETTQRFSDATAADLLLTPEQRMAKVARFDITTFGQAKFIKERLVDYAYLRPIPLRVKQFVPIEGDCLEKTWVDAQGVKKSVDLPPFAISSVYQYIAELKEYVNDNFRDWSKATGGPFAVIVKLMELKDTPTDIKLYLEDIIYFNFACIHKTSSAYLVGDEMLGGPAIREKGHRLDGKIISPRMILAQMDPVSTLAVLMPSQEKALDQLTALIATKDPAKWGLAFLSVASMCSLGAIMFADRKRHAQENSLDARWSVIEFVVEAAEMLMILIARFHESEPSFDREAVLEASHPLIKEFYSSIDVSKNTGDEDIEVPEWWLAQLKADAETWIPRPTPCMPLEEK
ncbi:hypothetical protein G7046_g2919 [Stylonectria norvegica]|nr:hypothetical protein G7046_g2919 [Stylonectria norvegica]